MNAHILIFWCPNCGQPMPFIRLDEGVKYPNLEQEVESVDLGCFESKCQSKHMVDRLNPQPA